MSANETDPEAMKGNAMSEADVDAFLTEHGHGVLALAADGDTYGIPVSYGYDGDRLYLVLLEFGETSKKLDLLATTDTATLVAYDVESPLRWRSVIIRGPIEAVGDDELEHMDAVMEDNAWFPTIHPPTEPVTGVTRVAMDIDAATGRVGPDG